MREKSKTAVCPLCRCEYQISVKLTGDILVDSGVATAEQRDVILFKQKRLVKNIFNKKGRPEIPDSIEQSV